MPPLRIGAWTRSILDRALERAGETARQTLPGSTAPLPAERHAAGMAGPRSGTAEVLIFSSLSVLRHRGTPPGTTITAGTLSMPNSRNRRGSMATPASWPPRRAPIRFAVAGRPSSMTPRSTSGAPARAASRAHCRQLAAGAACKVFGPLLRAFSLRHGLDVLAVSLTGEALEGWPEAVADRGRAARLGLGDAPVPALVLFDTATKRIVPVGFGVMAEDEMAERIYALTALEPGNDY